MWLIEYTQIKYILITNKLKLNTLSQNWGTPT